MPRTWPIPNLEDAVNAPPGDALALTANQMFALNWEILPAEFDADDETVELVPERMLVPGVFRCPRCGSAWPRSRWFDFVRDVRGIARFPEDFLCSHCLRTEIVYGGYLRSQWLTDIGAPPGAIAAMAARPPIQATTPVRTPPGARPPGSRPRPPRRGGP